MGLKAVVENLDNVDERYHDLYEERDGKYQLKRIEGMRTDADVERLQTALSKEREEHRRTKDSYSFLKGMDLDDVRERLDSFEELKIRAEKGDVSDEKLDQLVEARIKTKTAPLMRELDQLKGERDQLKETVGTFEAKEKRRTIKDAVTKAAQESKLRSEALEDAVMLAESVMQIDDEGNVITKDGVGVTPGVDPKVWLSDMQERRPHWWPESVGGGANGGRGKAGGGLNPWTAKNWNMTEQGRIFKENPDRAHQMAKAAGTKVGGGRPSED